MRVLDAVGSRGVFFLFLLFEQLSRYYCSQFQVSISAAILFID